METIKDVKMFTFLLIKESILLEMVVKEILMVFIELLEELMMLSMFQVRIGTAEVRMASTNIIW